MGPRVNAIYPFWNDGRKMYLIGGRGSFHWCQIVHIYNVFYYGIFNYFVNKYVAYVF